MEIQQAYYNRLQNAAALKILQYVKDGSRARTVSSARDTVSISVKDTFVSVSFSEGTGTFFYGNIKISVSYSGSKYYYHGQLLTSNELVQLAVTEGKMTMAEIEGHESSAGSLAFERMIEDEAKAKYSWSSSQYSEDGKYVFTTDENGKTHWNLVEDAEMGASLDEIAGWIICSGIPNRNIGNRYLDYLRKMDPDLYNAAQQIGKEVSTYNMLTDVYEVGVIGEAQHEYDLSLLAMLFGKSADDFYDVFVQAKKTGDYSELLGCYRPYAAETVNAIHEEQEKRTGGIF